MLAIVHELTGLDTRVDPKTALDTLGDMVAENGEVLNSANRRVYPYGLLNQRLDILRSYSQEVLRHVERPH